MLEDVMIDRVDQLTAQVPMHDGVRLHADLYLPADAGPHPVLVHRTAYGTRTASMIVQLVADPAVLAARGYAVVVQDVRGRFRSEGDWQPFVHEAADGYDTVEWAASQSWSNGRVGIYGSSYMGITTYQAVAADPPHLCAAAVWVAGSRFNNGMVRTGGAFRTRLPVPVEPRQRPRQHRPRGCRHASAPRPGRF